MMTRFLRGGNRKTILHAIGERVFPSADRKDQYERAKQLSNLLEMDGTLTGWLEEWGMPNSAERILAGLHVPIDDGAFDVGTYIRIQPERTAFLAERMPRLLV